MGSRAAITTMGAIPWRAQGRGTSLWRTLSHHQWAFHRTRSLVTEPAPFATISSLPCNSYRRSFSSSAPAFRQKSPVTKTASLPVEPEEGVKKKSDPLHILFCGSDEFSCEVLTALHAEHMRDPDFIRSIDVVVRPPKRVGRGLKVMQGSRVAFLADQLGLPIHQRDTFTGWDMPTPINLIIAVSFGLRVPARLLNSAKYGGLNLHPSLLPDLRGPAPLHHAFLRRRSLTGVTLQTLHPTLFDHGVILAQTPADPSHPAALRMPRKRVTTAELLKLVVAPAREMLVRGLRAGLHVPPLKDVGWEAQLQAQFGSDAAAARDRVLRDIGGDFESSSHTAYGTPLVHAPKIQTADRQIRLSAILGAAGSNSNKTPQPDQESDISLRQRVIGPLWFYSVDRRDGRRKRVIVTQWTDPALPHLNPPARSSSFARITPPAPQPAPSFRKPYAIAAAPSIPPAVGPSGPACIRVVIRFVDEPSDDVPAPPPPTGSKSARRLEKRNTAYRGAVTYVSLAVGPPPPGEPDRTSGCVYLAPDFRVERLKVEGEGQKAARLGLRSFVVGEVGDNGNYI
ncbi:Formyltransferase [Camillea tinctor]|nr:Formyltransferase [Camillea tinctor]